jgi:hypothetical protein
MPYSERRRLRNRIAASRYRQKQVEHIETLERRLRDILCSNSKLEFEEAALKEQVVFLHEIAQNGILPGCHGVRQ